MLGILIPDLCLCDEAISWNPWDCFARFDFGEDHASAQREGLAMTE